MHIPGDIIGVFDAGTMGVGDTLVHKTHKGNLWDFPVFPPEFLLVYLQKIL